MKTGSMFANGRIRSVRDIGFNFFDDLDRPIDDCPSWHLDCRDITVQNLTAT